MKKQKITYKLLKINKKKKKKKPKKFIKILL